MAMYSIVAGVSIEFQLVTFVGATETVPIAISFRGQVVSPARHMKCFVRGKCVVTLAMLVEALESNTLIAHFLRSNPQGFGDELEEVMDSDNEGVAEGDSTNLQPV